MGYRKAMEIIKITFGSQKLQPNVEKETQDKQMKQCVGLQLLNPN